MILLDTFWNIFQASLSKKELFEISGEISKGYAPVKPAKPVKIHNDSVPTQQELLEVSQNISRYFAPSISTNSQRLVVLPIDPQHLYIYWSLDENQDFKLSQRMINNGMVLRVYSQLKEKRAPAPVKPLVEIAINDFHSRQKIYLPAPETHTVYSASIGQTTADDSFVSLIDSNTAHVDQVIVEEGRQIKNQDNAVDYKSSGFMDAGVSNDSPGSVRAHYASTNKSGKGKRSQQ